MTLTSLLKTSLLKDLKWYDFYMALKICQVRVFRPGVAQDRWDVRMWKRMLRRREWGGYATKRARREMFSKSYSINPKADCIYRFQIDLEPNGHVRLCSKSIEKW